MNMAFLQLTGHLDSFTTNNGPVLINTASIEAVTSWQGGSRLVITSGATVYVAENVKHITDAMEKVLNQMGNES